MSANERDYSMLYGNIVSDMESVVAAKCRCAACNSCSCGRCTTCISQCTGCVSSASFDDLEWEAA